MCLLSPTVYASTIDLGNHGALFDVVEEDMIRVLKGRMEQARVSGKLDQFEMGVKASAKASIEHPKAISLPTAQRISRHNVDPTLLIENEIKTPDGHVLARAGDRLNPLDTLKPSKPLFFINGDDAEQVFLAERYKDKLIIVLTSGAPLSLEDKLEQAVFFDQGGHLTEKFSIHAVPAIVYPKGNVLKVIEFPSVDQKIIKAILSPIPAHLTSPESSSTDGVNSTPNIRGKS